MAITLVDVGSGHNRSSINSNFQAIEAEINNELLDRDGGKALRADLDFNSNDLLNGGRGDFSSLFVEGVRVYGGTGTAPTSQFPTITPMLALEGQVVGDVYTAGGTAFRVDTVTDPMVIDNYTALTPVNIDAFGAVEGDGSNTSPALQAAINYAAPKRITINVHGVYRFSSTVNLLSYTSINADGSQLYVSEGTNILFNADATTAAIDSITIVGGDWRADVPYDPVLERFQEELADIIFFNAQGAYNAGQRLYIWRTHFHRIKTYNFDWFMVGDYHRTWTLDTFFIYGRNGIQMKNKNAEVNITNGMIFGTDPTNAATRGVELGLDVSQPSDFAEGIRLDNLGIDNFGRGLSIYDVLDLAVTSCWVACTEDHTKYCVHFDAAGNNFMQGVRFSNNVYYRGKIKFNDKAAPPLTAILRMENEIYLSAQQIRIGQSWHDIVMEGWEIIQPPTPISTVAINAINDNQRMIFRDLKFKGAWTGLIHVNGSLSKDTIIDNVWSDQFVDDPFYTETRVMIKDSCAGLSLAGGRSNGGSMIWFDKIASGSTVAASNIISSPTLSFKPGALIEIKVGGLFNSSLATGALRFTESGGNALEAFCDGTGWSGEYVELGTAPQRLDASCIFKVISDDVVTINLESAVGTTTHIGFHTYMSIRYL